MFGLGGSEVEAIMLSLRVSVVATLASLPLALAAAHLLARTEFAGKQVFNAVIHLPLVLPPVAVGYLLLVSFGSNGFIGSFLEQTFGFSFAFRWTGAALAAAIMAFPLMVRAMRLSIEAVDPGLEDAAATLGASPVWVWLTVTLPLTLPGILAGMVLGFARAIGEFGATITFVSNIPGETRTIPTAIYTFLQVPGGESAALALVGVSVAIAFGAVIVSEMLARKARSRSAGP